MVETLFGQSPQLWPTLPLPTVPSVYFQTPRGVANGPGGLAPQFGGQSPMTINGPILTGPEMSGGGVTAQALLAVVAARRGQGAVSNIDADVEDFISDALDLLPGATEIDVRCEEGRVTLSGTAPNKRVKRDAGEIVWAIPGISDLQNNIAIAARRRSRTSRREGEPAGATQNRKSA
jgi:hypothetical protein